MKRKNENQSGSDTILEDLQLDQEEDDDERRKIALGK